MPVDELDSKVPDHDEGTRRQKAKSKLSEFLRTFQHHQSFSLYGIEEVRRSVIKISSTPPNQLCCVQYPLSRHRLPGESV